MPMPKPEMAFYAIPADDDHPYERVGHFIKGHAPKGSREIGKDEADTIEADVTARSPKATVQSLKESPQVHVDLQPILDKLDAQSKLLAEHAELHDQHVQKLADHARLIEEKDEEIRKRTAKAIADLTADIGTSGVGG